MSIKINSNIIKRIFLLLAVLILVYYLYKNYNELKLFTISVDYKFLMISFLLLLTACIILPIEWYLITQSLGCVLSFKETIRIRLISEIGKYVPGRVFGYGYLMLHYKEAGKDQIKVWNSSFYELFLSTFSAFLFFSLMLLFTSFQILDRYKPVFFAIAFLGIIALHPSIFRIASDFFCWMFKKERVKFQIAYSKTLLLLVIYLIFWVIFSLGFFFFVRAFTEVKFTDISYLSGSFAISTFAGFMAFFLPAGLGAREGLLIYLLECMTGNALAIFISLGSRLWLITADSVLFIVSLLTGFIAKRIYKEGFNSKII